MSELLTEEIGQLAIDLAHGGSVVKPHIAHLSFTLKLHRLFLYRGISQVYLLQPITPPLLS